jgi:hypothetical protein
VNLVTFSWFFYRKTPVSSLFPFLSLNELSSISHELHSLYEAIC